MSATPDSTDSVRRGVRIALWSHAIGLPLCLAVGVGVETSAAASRGVYPEGYVLRLILLPVLFGWTQLLYMPAPALWLLARRRFESLKGLGIAVGVAFLVTSGCTGLVWVAERVKGGPVF